MLKLDALKSLVREERYAEAWRKLYAETRDAQDFPTMSALTRVWRVLAAQSSPPEQPAFVKLALLSDSTTAMIEDALVLSLEAIGVGCTLHVAPFNTVAHEVLDAESATARFKPDLTIVMATTSSFPAWPAWTAPTAEVDRMVNETCDYWLGLCRSLRDRTGCDVILSNFHAPTLRPLGSAGVRQAADHGTFVRRVNDQLARRAPSFVHIQDVEWLAALHGTGRWFDPRFWYHARQAVSFDALVPCVRNLAAIVGAIFGRSAKCVVVDLDNTIWGGIVGDDGPDSLLIGEGDPQGEAFVAFQRYLLALKERGVALAVASKNDESMALAPFTTRPEMVLRREDFAVFRASWAPKSDTIREIASTLNIGLDAVVVVDDNPAERAQIRQALPDVRVLEVGADPSEYPMLLDRSGWLETVALSFEDQSRTRMFAANAERSQLAASAEDYDAYLRSLDQRAVIAPFEPRYLDRIQQLTNKTNQFNLTTRRMSDAHLSAMMTSPDHITAYVRLADRFGDNGLISVFAAHREEDELCVDLWLMSCRVLERGVERALCNYVVERARGTGLTSLRGIYVPTSRNALVKDHYQKLGFTYTGTIDGADHWLLDLRRARLLGTHITIVEDYGKEVGAEAHEEMHV